MNPYIRAMEKQAVLMEMLSHGIHMAGAFTGPGAGMHLAGVGAAAHAAGLGAAKLATKTVPHVGKLGQLGNSPVLKGATRLATANPHAGDSLVNTAIGVMS